MEELYQNVANIIHGKFSYKQGIDIDYHSTVGNQDAWMVIQHEHVHADLVDNSAYGLLHRRVSSLSDSQNIPSSFRLKLKQVFSKMLRSSIILHEGLASYRSVVWYCTNRRFDDAQAYLDALPDVYQNGYLMSTKVLGDPFLDPPTIFEVPGKHWQIILLGIIAMNSTILDHYSDLNLLFSTPLNFIESNSPDDRFKQLTQLGNSGQLFFQQMVQFFNEKNDEEELTTKRFAAVTDEAIHMFKNAFPKFPVIDWNEKLASLERMNDSWKIQFETLFNSGIEFTTDSEYEPEFERIMGIRLHKLNNQKAVIEKYYQLNKVEDFLDFFDGLRSLWMFVLIFPDFYKEGGRSMSFGEQPIMIIWFPMNPAPGEIYINNSLVFSIQAPKDYHLLFRSEASQLFKKEAPFDNQACFWYVYEDFSRFINANDENLPGVKIIRYGTTLSLIRNFRESNQEKYHYKVYEKDNIFLYAILGEKTFQFSPGHISQRDYFLRTMGELALNDKDNSTFDVGMMTVSHDLIAKAALIGSSL